MFDKQQKQQGWIWTINLKNEQEQFSQSHKALQEQPGVYPEYHYCTSDTVQVAFGVQIWSEADLRAADGWLSR